MAFRGTKYEKKFMKRIVIFLIVFFCWSVIAQPEDVDAKIQLALEKLMKSTEKEILQAKETLIQIGAPALPKLRQKLALLTYLVAKLDGKGITVKDENTKKEFQLEEYFATKFIQAEQLFKLKKYTKTLEFIDAITLLEPNNPLKHKFSQLREQCKEQQFQKEILTASLFASENYYEMGNSISVKYVLKNQTESEVFIPKEVVQESEKLFGSDQTLLTKAILQVKWTLKDNVGNIATTLFEYTQEITQDIKLAKNEQFTLTFPFFPDHQDFQPQQFLYREFELVLVLFPAQIVVSSKPTFKAQIKSTPVTLKVLPKGLLEFKEDPLTPVSRLYQSKKLEKLFFATLLFHQKDKVKGIDFFMAALPQANSEERKILLVCLRELTGQNLGWDIDQWRYWWKAKRELFEY